MKIFTLLGADGYELAQPVNSDDYDTLIHWTDGVRRRESWIPIRMRLFTEEDGLPLRDSDAPWMGMDPPVFRLRAVQVMTPLLAPHGEFLPLVCEGADIFVFNCTRVVNALDEAASELERFDEDGGISWIRRHVFHADMIRGLPAFKLAGLRVSHTYVGEEFVARWNEAGLRGLTFTQVWEG